MLDFRASPTLPRFAFGKYDEMITANVQDLALFLIGRCAALTRAVQSRDVMVLPSVNAPEGYRTTSAPSSNPSSTSACPPACRPILTG